MIKKWEVSDSGVDVTHHEECGENHQMSGGGLHRDPNVYVESNETLRTASHCKLSVH